jgi:hypothetical protein
MFRLGYGREVRPVPRRPVEEVLRRETPDRGLRSDALALRTPPPIARPNGAAERPAAH